MNYNEKKHRFVPEDHRSFDDPPATSKQQTAAKCGTVGGSRIKRWEGCVAGRRRGRRRSGEDARGARYQFSLRGKTVAAPLIDRKILICLTRELLGREEGGVERGKKETSLKLCLTAAWRSEDKGGRRAERRGVRERGNKREREREKNISSRCRDARSETHTS